MRGGWYVAMAGYALLITAWLVLGAMLAAASHWPSFLAALSAANAPGSSAWADSWPQGVLVGVHSSEPVGQAVLDYLFSVFNLAIAAALWWHGRQERTVRLLTIAVIGSAGAFNLQAHTGISVFEVAFQMMSEEWWLILLPLHGVSGVAYALALVLFPTGRWDIGGPNRWPTRAVLGAGIVGVPVLLALSNPGPGTFVVCFGVLIPLTGLLAQRYRVRHGLTPKERQQSQLLFTALTIALLFTAALGVVTLALSWLHVPGLTLYDPTGHTPGALDEPTALVFWFARLAFTAMSCAVLVVSARSWSWGLERFFSRGLAHSLILAVLLGTGFLVLVAAINAIFSDSGALAVVLATVVVAVLFQPLRIRLERILDRLVHSNTPAPYSVLAQVAGLSRAATTDHADLSVVAEAVARGLDTSFCRLTLCLPKLGDLHYEWPRKGTCPTEQLTFPLLHNGEQVGALTVDRPSVARLTGDRRRLVDDLGGVLGPVLHNSRLGVELADQLRRTRQRAEAIVCSRRRGVAEMDSERRALERDLHDGAQHHLVALRMTVGLIEHELTHGRPEAARDRLADVLAQVDTTRKVLTDTAAGTFPITLAERGLLPALAEQLRDAEPAVVLDLDDTACTRFPLAVETAVYFTCLEAVNNARKHAPGATVRVSVRREQRGLAFTVSDDGPGFWFDHAALPEAHGLHNIGDRTNTVGGTLTVHSAPGAGTIVEGHIPL